MLKRIQALVAGNQIQEALDLLLTETQALSPTLQQQVSLLRAQWEELQTQEMLGLIAFDTYTLQKNNITHGLLKMIGIVDQQQQIAKPKQTILFLAANPTDTEPLRIDQEIREIQEGLKMSKFRDEIRFETRLAVRAKDLRRALLEIEPSIVHFSGHGSRLGKLAIESDGGNERKLLKPEPLAMLLGLFADSIQCVLLNACYSVTQADHIVQHIPYVVGMEDAISDKGFAIPFAVGFYDAIGAGRDIPFAFEIGKNSIELEDKARSEALILREKGAPSSSD